MTNKNRITGAAAALGMLILILDGKTALSGARSGIELCLKTVIPSLLPFILLSILLTGAFLGTNLPFLRPLGRYCGIPRGAESLLVAGFLGGYPVGAQSIAAAFQSGQLSRRDSERMLSFCSNAGPAFLFGMTAAMFPDRKTAWVLWLIHIVSALSVSRIFRAHNASEAVLTAAQSPSLSDSLTKTLRVMAAICGWVILFRVVTAFLSRWFLWLLPMDIQVAVIGLLELSNGCCSLNMVENVDIRFLLCSAMLAFGGLCVAMQTKSVTAGLSLRYYYLGKLLQSAFSLILSVAAIHGYAVPACAIALLLSAIPRVSKKRSSIPGTVGV